MKPYEQLLKHDPIAAFKKIKDDYIRYFTTTFSFSDENLNTKKDNALKSNDNLTKEPYCEVLPKYQEMNKDLSDLCNNYPKEYPNAEPLPKKFAEFINMGLLSYPPYRHQFEMLLKGYGQKKDVLICSGTGSGKTESFLLPLFASLLKEAQEWGAPKNSYNPTWWQNRDQQNNYYASQREDETRPDAIRSLLLYPMNALVADQVGRLREALDSNVIRSFLDENCNGNRIFFGSYNGKTLEIKKNLAEELNKINTQANNLIKAVEDGICDEKDIYVAPRLSTDSFTSEMLVREDMHEKCPDILITNISMLSLMLMRSKEQAMLDRTKKFYEDNSDAVFHLVVDELHLHRGTAGAEVAYLLRMFLERIGVPPMKNGKKNKQLRIFASSASLDSVQEYLSDFFGIYGDDHKFEIQNGYDIEPSIDPNLSKLDYSKFDVFYKNNSASTPYYLQDDNEKERTKTKFLNEIAYRKTFEEFVNDYSGIIYKDLKALSTDEITSFPLSKMEQLNGSPSDDAIHGFLIFRAVAKNKILPNIRFHVFYKYIDGLWGELLPSNNNGSSPIGEVLFHPEEISSNGEHKVLELLRCECCGELFIGGNKTQIDGGIALSLNSPNLDIIPNMQATPMVQRKTAKEYAIFWPHSANQKEWYHNNYENQHESFSVVNTKDKYKKNVDKCYGAWKRGYLNPFDGSIVFELRPGERDNNNLINGYLYFPRDKHGNEILIFDNHDIVALPCKCPKCNKDYHRRLYTKSPIRSFRTGMGRNNQLLSKELIYQLDSDDRHKAKLIGFSDSRQDAAEQSKFIAKEHYRDILRLLFINLIKNKINGSSTKELDTIKNAIIIYLENSNLDPFKILNISGLSKSELNGLKNIYYSEKNNQEKINEIRDYTHCYKYIDLDKLISRDPNQLNGELTAELLQLGINPSGTKRSDMYPIDNETYWDNYYNFDQYCLNNENWANFGERTYNSLESSIFDNCFGQYMNVNTEVAGLGYVASGDIGGIPEVGNLKNLLNTYLTDKDLTIEGVINAFIRIFGDFHRYKGDIEPRRYLNYADLPSAIQKVVRKLSNLTRVDENVLGQCILEVMKKVATDADGLLKINKLRFALSHSEDVYYKCEKCKRIHLHRGLGFCTSTSCMEDLNVAHSGKVDDLWNNFISFDVFKEPHTPQRLHTEELTGQTDDQTSRLLQFKDIIIDANQQRTRSIDMLNVTTTMEVGVDIGSLQAIYQGNMPPTRYNYQQRVGRAGRRNQAFSAALTFCRGRSHDNYYYYKATDIITGGKPANPTISVNPIVDGVANLVIIKRVILKHILMLISANRSDWYVEKGTSGQLGYKQMWGSQIKPEIENWIVTNQERIKEIISYYTRQYLDDNSEVNTEICSWINNDVVNEMTDAVANSIKDDNALAITEAGLLPMYGLPAVVVNLYHTGYTRYHNRTYKEILTGTIDRPIWQAISEFAPGSIKTKDGADYQSAGITIPLDMVKCRNAKDIDLDSSPRFKDLDPLEYSFNLTMDGNTISNIGEYNQNEIKENVYRLVIPKAFRTNKIINNKGDSLPEDDKRSNFSLTNTWVRDKSENKNKNKIENGALCWKVWNGSNQKRDIDIWYVNTNNGDLFYGQRVAKISNRGNNTQTIEPKYISGNIPNDKLETVIKNAPNFMIYDRDRDINAELGAEWRWVNQPEQIALGAKKITDIICLSFDEQSIPKCIELSALSGNKSAIIAAMYSAATLIQRTFADNIDIAPEEIEISEVKIDPQSGLPSVYLNDTALNGAGFISLLCSKDPQSNKLKLQEIMEDIVSKEPKSKFIRMIREHKSECKTTCSKCLNTFYNRSLHHVLDWRLGMDIIKLMLDKNYDMGYHDLRNSVYGGLSELLNEVGKRVEKANPRSCKYEENDGIDWTKGFFIRRMRRESTIEHLVHPLWNVAEQSNKDGYKAQDIFTLQRSVIKPQVPQVITDNPNPVPNNTREIRQPNNTNNDDYGELG